MCISKLVIAIVQDRDADTLLQELAEQEYPSTKLSSTGGFLGKGNTTLLIGCSCNDTEDILEIIRENCQPREKTVSPIAPIAGGRGTHVPSPVEITVGGATVFVLDVEEFIQL